MPVFFQHDINETDRLAVWHITENESFFTNKVSIQREIRHPHKRLQHLAGRYLLQLIEPDFPVDLISIAATKKPLLADGKFHFSISHCGDFAAAIVSKQKSVGIDVELVTPKIELIKNKFLSEEEQELLPAPDLEFLTLFWSAKEAMYKWYGAGELSFKNHMVIKGLQMDGVTGSIQALFHKTEPLILHVGFRFFDSLCLAWV